jgi:hypothetical protein
MNFARTKIIPLILLTCGLVAGGCKRHAAPSVNPSSPEPASQAAAPTDATALPANIRPALVLYYDFNTGPVDGKVPDQSGRGNDGQAVGVQWVADGHQGGSVLFGLTNSYITVPNNDSINPPHLTMAAWIKTSYKDWVWRRIFDKGTGKGYVLSMCGIENDNHRSFEGQVDIEPGKTWAHSGMQVTDGQWHHVVGTFDGAFAKIYVDGWRAGSQGHWVGELPNTSYDLTIGANRSNPDPAAGEVGASFNGMMDDVMMFNRALSDDEVQELFQSLGGVLGPKPAPPPPPAGSQPKPSAADRLKQLKDLLDQGLINQDQYDQKKKEILDSM